MEKDDLHQNSKTRTNFYAYLKLPVSQMIDILNVHVVMSSIATAFMYNNREEVIYILQVI